MRTQIAIRKQRLVKRDDSEGGNGSVSVIWFRKRITPEAPAGAGVRAEAGSATARAFGASTDLEAWLRLQNDAFRRPRPWTEREFRRELAGRADWRADRLLVVDGLPQSASGGTEKTLAASVYLDLPPDAPIVHLHWLAVQSALRHRGLGRLLIEEGAALGRSCGRCWLVAETLATWPEAVGFYTALGFTAGPPGIIPPTE